MNANNETLSLELVCVIVNDGLGSRVMKSAKQNGFSGGTITFGKGTANSRLLDYLGLSDIRKEIIYLAAEQSTAYQALEKINKEFHFHKLTMELCLPRPCVGYSAQRMSIARNRRIGKGRVIPCIK